MRVHRQKKKEKKTGSFNWAAPFILSLSMFIADIICLNYIAHSLKKKTPPRDILEFPKKKAEKARF